MNYRVCFFLVLATFLEPMMASDESFLFRERDTDRPRIGRRLFVRVHGDDALDGTSPTTAWKTIQHAADMARAGDVVFVGAGTYDGQIVPGGIGNAEQGSILFVADRNGKETGDAGTIEVTCDHSPPISLDSHFLIEFDGFVFRGEGSNSELAAAQCIDSSVRFRNCEFQGWMTGVRARQSQLILQDCLIQKNLEWGIRADDYQAVIQNCVIKENRKGGIHLRCLPARAADQKTDEPQDSGWRQIPDRTFFVVGSQIQDNGGAGVAAKLADLGKLAIQSSAVQRNQGIGCEAFQTTLLSIDDSQMCENQGSGIDVRKSGQVAIRKSQFRKNHDAGASLQCTQLQMRNSLVVQNKDGLRFEGSPTAPVSRMWNNTVACNRGAFGVRISGGELEVVNTVIASNGEFGLYRFAGVLYHHHNLFWDHVEDIHSSKIGDAEIFAEPRFFDIEAGDFRLQRTSRAVNRGAEPGEMFADDIDGNPRPLFRRTDMGAYESVEQPGVRFIHEWRELSAQP